MKKVLFLDREYATLFVNSYQFESIYVCLGRDAKKTLEKRGLRIVGCFEEEYDHLPIANVPDDYLIYSFSSDRFLTRRFDYSKRLEILGKEISFWSKILDDQKPDLIVNEVCTIEFMEVLYIEAKKRGIEYKPFLYGFQDNYAYWLSSPFNSEISDEKWRGVIITEEIKKKANDFCDALIEKRYRPYYVRNLNNNVFRSILAGFHGYLEVQIRAIRHIGHFYYEDYRQIWSGWMRARFARLFRHYDHFEDVKETEYVFFPLHYVPEATISYFSEFYSNQSSVIEEVAKCLKTNQRLVVKEHPQQVGVLLTREYDDVKKRNPNIIYLPGSIISNDIINNCKLIVTITGTAGFEGMILGKPVITLGKVFYNHCSQVNRVASYAELKQMIRNENYKVPNNDEVRHFVSEFFALQEPGQPSMTADKENLENFTHYIEQQLANE